MRDVTSTVNGELDPDLDRYGAAIRRSLWKVALAAVLLGVLFMVLLGSSSSTTSVHLEVDQATGALAAVGLDVAFEEIPSTVGARDVLCRPEEDVDDTTCTALLDPTSPEVIIFDTGADSTALSRSTSDQRLDALSTWIGTQRESATQAPIALIDQQRTQIQDRLRELDTEIAALPNTQALRDAYLDERADLTTASLRLDDQSRALQSFAVSPTRVRVLASSTTSSNTRVLWLIVGVLVGGLLAFCAVVVHAHFDRRIRSRRELDSLLGTGAWPVLPRAGAERETARTATASALERALGGSQLVVVTLSGKSSATVGGEIASLVPGAAVVATSAITMDSVVGRKAIIAAAIGEAHGDDVARAQSYLSAVGCEVLGGVLGNVPAKGLRAATI